MEFLKINKFAGLLAIACACLFPGLTYAGYIDNPNPPTAQDYIYCKDGVCSAIVTNCMYAQYVNTNTMSISSIQQYCTGHNLDFQNGNLVCNYTLSNGVFPAYCEYNGKSLTLQGFGYGSYGYILILPYSPLYFSQNYYMSVNSDAYTIDYIYENIINFSTAGVSILNSPGYGWKFGLDQSELIDNWGNPPVPPSAPVVINGLNCKTDIIPDLPNTTWYNNFMNNTGFLQNIDDDGWNRMFSWSGTIYDLPEAQYVNRAALFYADQTAGGNFASGSLNYPGTARTTIRGGNKSPLLLSFSDSEIRPNVVQWHGVNEVALGYAGTIQFQNTQLQDSTEVPISASGGIATAVISGNERINKVLLNYSSGFNGFRYGVAPTTSKSSCSYKYNLCEWSIEGANTVCQSGNLVGGIPAGNCVITGSGSVYGSGACVPETNSSGAIIPPVMVPGVTVYDSEGNPVGNIYENESPVPEFTCGFSDDDNGLDTIGKSFKCAVSYIQNTFNVGKQGIDTIQVTSQTLGQSVDINPTTSTGSATGALSNPLLAQLQGVDEGASETKYLKMTFGFFVFFFTILIVAVLATVLKGGIKNYFNQ